MNFKKLNLSKGNNTSVTEFQNKTHFTLQNKVLNDLINHYQTKAYSSK